MRPGSWQPKGLRGRSGPMAVRVTFVVTLVASLLFGGCQIDPTICTTGLTPCGQTGCADLTQDSFNCGACGQTCGISEACENSICICEAPGTLCDSTCTLLAVDPNHCGACGNACTANQVCQQGSCVEACTLGQATVCNGGCVVLSEDNNDCGACGTVCTSPQTCVNSVCQNP